jgi:hypothetical protein
MVLFKTCPSSRISEREIGIVFICNANLDSLSEYPES